MTGSIEALLAATILFVGGHLLISGTALRDSLIQRLGTGRYKGLYSLLMAATLVWMIWAYIDAPFVDLWTAGIAIKHVPLTMMIPVFIVLVAADMGGNPTKLGSATDKLDEGPRGIVTITRHPLLWAIALWALMHVAANGHLAALILFGGFAVLALLGTLSIDAKKRTLSGAAWETFMNQTSNIPFAAAIGGRTKIDWRGIGLKPVIIGIVAYAVVLVFHEFLFGVAPAGFVSGLF